MMLASNLSRKYSGFTLIELIVVIAIMAISYSLVAPNLFGAFDSSKATADRKEAVDLIKALGYKAFINDKVVIAKFSGRNIVYGYKQDKKRVTKTFENISFPPQQIYFSSAGFPDNNELKLEAKGKIVRVDLYDYFY